MDGGEASGVFVRVICVENGDCSPVAFPNCHFAFLPYADVVLKEKFQTRTRKLPTLHRTKRSPRQHWSPLVTGGDQ